MDEKGQIQSMVQVLKYLKDQYLLLQQLKYKVKSKFSISGFSTDSCLLGYRLQ